ncbi:MAG: flavodoxin family protein [Oscillospiraceae bacterium]|nr:flavodoxin family protein [Oscillospiraceae bacterium]
MRKKLLAILGSPHDNGATAAMLDCAVKAAASQGWEITTISLYKKKISFCQGCRACIKTGQCVLQDDIREIAALIKTCDRVVLSAPTYWANVPAVVKNLFDRLLGTAMEETAAFPRPRLSKNQDYLLLTACNTPFPFSQLCGQSSGALRAMNEFFKTSGMKRLGSVTFSNTKGRAELPHGITRKIEKLLQK